MQCREVTYIWFPNCWQAPVLTELWHQGETRVLECILDYTG